MALTPTPKDDAWFAQVDNRLAALEKAIPKPGPQGPAGPQGVQGLQGIQGVAGPAGHDGAPGPAGHDGAQGIPGPQGPPGTGGGGGSPIPPDTNVYPLKMTPVATPGAPVTLGVGPDSLVLALSSTGASGPPDNVVAILMDGVAIAGPLDITNYGGSGQIFTIQGSWGPLPHNVEIVSGNSGLGLSNLRILGVSYNFVPLVYNGPSVDARGALPPPNATVLWDNLGLPVTFNSTTVVPPPPPPPPPPPSTISGALINGAAQAPATLASLVAATPSGGTLALPAGNFIGTTSIPVPMTIAGAGMGKTIINATNLEPTYDKAVFVPLAAGITVENMSIENAQISTDLGNNAAAVRDNGPGIGFSVVNVEISGCQDGLLTFPSNINVTGCNFHDNGAGDAHTHEMYFGGDTGNVVTLLNTNSKCGAGSTHALKSRAGTTNVTGGTFIGNGDTTGNIGGSVIDIPDGGLASISGSTLVTTAGSANHGFITFAVESNANAAIGDTLTLDNVVFTDNTGTGGIIQSGLSTATLVLSGCTYTRATAPTIVGWGTVTGAVAKG